MPSLFHLLTETVTKLSGPASAFLAPDGTIVRNGRLTWGVGASLLAHAVLLALLLAMLPAPDLLAPPPENEVQVEILTPGQFDALVPRPTPARPEPVPPPAAPGDPAEPPEAMIQARTMLSGRALAGPRARQAREALRFVDGTERMIQLCDLEAMEQIQEWKPEYQPERLVAYAMSEVKVRGTEILSDGGAFRSKGDWFRVAFRCDLSADGQKVAAFQFSVGGPVPRPEWEARHLAAED